MAEKRRHHQRRVAELVRASTLARVAEQEVDRRRVAGAYRDHEHRIAVAVEHVGIGARASKRLIPAPRSLTTATTKSSCTDWARAAGHCQAKRARRSATVAMLRRRRGPSLNMTRLRGIDPEQAEEVGRGRLRDLLERNAAQPRDLRRDVRHKGRLVALAAKRHRREIGRVGLDQHAIERHAPRDVLDVERVLERDDARERDVEAEVERGPRDVPGFGEAVHHAAGIARVLLAHERKRVGARQRACGSRAACRLAAPRGCARGSARAASRGRLRAGSSRVRSRRSPRLLAARERHERIDRGLGRVLGVGMHADGRVQIGVRRGERVHRGPSRQVHADAQRVRDARRGHRVEQRRQLGGELGEIEMAMGIDVHR